MTYSTKEYCELKSDPLPYKTKGGFEVDVMEGNCPECDSELFNLKISINEYKDFCIIRPVGLCRKCKLIITCKTIKITHNNEIYFLNQNKWCKFSFGFLDRVRQWFRKIIYK